MAKEIISWKLTRCTICKRSVTYKGHEPKKLLCAACRDQEAEENFDLDLWELMLTGTKSGRVNYGST